MSYPAGMSLFVNCSTGSKKNTLYWRCLRELWLDSKWSKDYFDLVSSAAKRENLQLILWIIDTSLLDASMLTARLIVSHCGAPQVLHAWNNFKFICEEEQGTWRHSSCLKWSFKSFLLSRWAFVALWSRAVMRRLILICRCTEQRSSSMSLTRRRTCPSANCRSSACSALIWDRAGPGVFTATRASVSSPTGPSSSPSGASLHSSIDTPSRDHTRCPLKS